MYMYMSVISVMETIFPLKFADSSQFHRKRTEISSSLKSQPAFNFHDLYVYVSLCVFVVFLYFVQFVFFCLVFFRIWFLRFRV